MTQFPNSYDLEERTAKFGENVIAFCRMLQETVISKPLIKQVVRSSTSIGANYMEANAASSKKESQETKHWLRMIVSYFPYKKKEAVLLWKEVQELTMIFQKITNSLRN